MSKFLFYIHRNAPLAPEEVSIIAKTLISFSGDTFSVYAGEGIQLIHTAKKTINSAFSKTLLRKPLFSCRVIFLNQAKGSRK